jgi:hypothetical protein
MKWDERTYCHRVSDLSKFLVLNTNDATHSFRKAEKRRQTRPSAA